MFGSDFASGQLTVTLAVSYTTLSLLFQSAPEISPLISFMKGGETRPVGAGVILCLFIIFETYKRKEQEDALGKLRKIDQ
jgi:hypothetical protein